MTQLVNGHRCWYDTGTPRLTGQSRLSALNPHAWRQAIRPPLPKAPAGRAGPAVRIRKTGHASRPRTTPRSISSRNNSSTRDNRGCAATATAARRCQAGSGLGPRASFTPFAPKCAGPACPAMSNAAWRGGGMGCRRWASLGSFPRTRGPIPRDLSITRPGRHLPKQLKLVVMGPCVRRADSYDSYAVTASAKSSSSSSSTGANVESGLVESVIGLRLP